MTPPHPHLIDIIRADLLDYAGEARRAQRRAWKRCVHEERNDRQLTSQTLRPHFRSLPSGEDRHVDLEVTLHGALHRYRIDRHQDTIARHLPFWRRLSDAEIEETFRWLR